MTPLTPRQGAEALSKWRSEREADRKALDDALGLNAPAEDAQSSEEETALVAADRKLQEAATEYEAAREKVDKAREEIEKLRDEIRTSLTESTETKAQLQGAVADVTGRLFTES